jgi:hypothetical protein
MLRVRFPPSHPHTVLFKQQMLFGALKKKKVPLILKVLEIIFFLSRAKHILGHLLGFFLGAETFLTPKKGLGPQEKPHEMLHYMFCPRKKLNKKIPDFQNQRYINSYYSFYVTPASRHPSIPATSRRQLKEYEILRSPGSGASLLKTGQVYNYCAMRSICLLIRAISPTFLPLYPGHSRFHQINFHPSFPRT